MQLQRSSCAGPDIICATESLKVLDTKNHLHWACAKWDLQLGHMWAHFQSKEAPSWHKNYSRNFKLQKYRKATAFYRKDHNVWMFLNVQINIFLEMNKKFCLNYFKAKLKLSLIQTPSEENYRSNAWSLMKTFIAENRWFSCKVSHGFNSSQLNHTEVCTYTTTVQDKTP